MILFFVLLLRLLELLLQVSYKVSEGSITVVARQGIRAYLVSTVLEYTKLPANYSLILPCFAFLHTPPPPQSNHHSNHPFYQHYRTPLLAAYFRVPYAFIARTLIAAIRSRFSELSQDSNLDILQIISYPPFTIWSIPSPSLKRKMKEGKTTFITPLTHCTCSSTYEGRKTYPKKAFSLSIILRRNGYFKLGLHSFIPGLTNVEFVDLSIGRAG